MDRKALTKAQKQGDIVGAETILRSAYETDVTAVLKKWRRGRGLPGDPLAQLRKDGVIQALGKQRRAERKAAGITPGAGGAYA